MAPRGSAGVGPNFGRGPPRPRGSAGPGVAAGVARAWRGASARARRREAPAGGRGGVARVRVGGWPRTCKLPVPTMPTQLATSLGWTCTTALSLPMSMREMRCCARPFPDSAASICPMEGGAVQLPLTRSATVACTSGLGEAPSMPPQGGATVSSASSRRVDRFFVSPPRVLGIVSARAPVCAQDFYASAQARPGQGAPIFQGCSLRPAQRKDKKGDGGVPLCRAF